MDVLLIVRDALASSLIGSLLAARDAHAAGRSVAVLVTGEALAAAAGGTFGWPRELAGQAMRLGLADRGGRDLGLPLVSKGEGRQLDAKGLLAATAAEGVTIYACPLWSAHTSTLACARWRMSLSRSADARSRRTLSEISA